MSVNFDVIVIGGGGAGLAAAYHAARDGASVIILEASSALGGATALATGVVYAAGTSVQRAAGIVDSADDMYHYMMTLNQWSIKPDLARRLCDSGATIIDWLIELGNIFPPDLVVESGVGGRPRGHQSAGAGAGIVQSLVNAVGALGVEVALGTRVDELIHENGRVVGVRADGFELRSHAVIITTGGFANDPDMVQRLWPSAAAHGEHLFSIYAAAPFNVGDGITLAETAGANVTGFDNGLLVTSPTFAHSFEAFLPEWAMVVNQDGKRFIPEDATYAVSGYLINEQPGRRCFAIFGEAAMHEMCADDRSGGHYVNGSSTDCWRVSTLLKQVERGNVASADSIATLALRAGIDADNLEASVDRYNRFMDQGEDREFFKKSAKFYPVRKGPLYAVELRASAIVSCHAGLEITADGRVVTAKGTIIHGLYAGGEVLGCTLGRRYIGGGIGIANAMTFGRIAGLTAAVDSRRWQGTRVA